MSSKSRLAVVAFLMFYFVLAQANESKNRLMAEDPLITEALARAPYFKYKMDIYLHRLLSGDCPDPLLNELVSQLRHFSPDANSFIASHEYSENLTEKNTTSWLGGAGPFKVNNTNSACWHTAVAFSPLSNLYLIVWQDERQGVNNPDIYGQYFNRSLELLGTNFRIHSENAEAAQATPAVAATADGGFVVAWEDYREGPPAIFYRSFNAARAAKGPEAKADSMQEKEQYFPALSADNSGFFTLAWLQDDDGDYNIYARKYKNDGQGQNIGFKVNTDYGNLQWAPAVASSLNGQTLIVWEDKRNGNSDIFCQRLRADGTRQASDFRINETESGNTQWRPFAAAQAGLFVVCWEDFRHHPNALYSQWFDASMMTVGANVRIDDQTSAGIKEYPTLAINSNLQSLFTWQDSRNGNWDIYGRWCDAIRVPQNVFSLNAEPDSADQNRPHVIAGDDLSTFVWLNDFGQEGKQHVYVAQYLLKMVPVELAFFRTRATATEVYLEWLTLTESNNLGFEIQRKTKDQEFQKITFISGKGTTTIEHSYSYLDQGLLPGTYIYRLKQIDFDGEYAFSDCAEVVVGGPGQFSLQQNYPNPFKAQTDIGYQILGDTPVTFRVLNLLGQEIRTLVAENKIAGFYSVNWDGKNGKGENMPSGMYIYSLQAGSFTEIKKMLLLR